MKYAGVIPARYRSTRFPGKPLVPLLGKPLILYVAELTAEALGSANTYVATDDRRIADVVERAGFQTVITSSLAATGTDRVWEAAQRVPADIYVNVQGDEPLIDPLDIRRVLEEKMRRVHGVVNGMCRIGEAEDPGNLNIPKVVTTEDRRMVYMSRLAIPGYKAPERRPRHYWKQVCIYAFTYEELKAFGTFGRKGELESHEDIEVLRFLELSIPVYMVETGGASLSVDVPEDVVAVESALRKCLSDGPPSNRECQ